MARRIIPPPPKAASEGSSPKPEQTQPSLPKTSVESAAPKVAMPKQGASVPKAKQPEQPQPARQTYTPERMKAVSEYQSKGFSPFESHALAHYDETGSHHPELHAQGKQNPSKAFLNLIRPIANKVLASSKVESAARQSTDTPKAFAARSIHATLAPASREFHSKAQGAAGKHKSLADEYTALHGLFDTHFNPHHETLKNLRDVHESAGIQSLFNQAKLMGQLTGQTSLGDDKSSHSGEILSAMKQAEESDGGPGYQVSSDPHSTKVGRLIGSKAVREHAAKKQEGIKQAIAPVAQRGIKGAQKMRESAEQMAPSAGAGLSQRDKDLLWLYGHAHKGLISSALSSRKEREAAEGEGGGEMPLVAALANAYRRYDPENKEGFEDPSFAKKLSSSMAQARRNQYFSRISPLARKLERKFNVGKVSGDSADTSLPEVKSIPVEQYLKEKQERPDQPLKSRGVEPEREPEDMDLPEEQDASQGEQGTPAREEADDQEFSSDRDGEEASYEMEDPEFFSEDEDEEPEDEESDDGGWAFEEDEQPSGSESRDEELARLIRESEEDI
jgi:hypothetical protein